ncbi:MAG: PIG-L family deacetylase [Anaerolineae bacterium]|nr:PIG-L family deacetylase [Anaerolineae bacterium]
MPESIAYRTPKRVLVMVAHPDDPEFGAGGSIARWIAAGAEVFYAILTDGSIGSADRAMTASRLAALRREEQLAAAKVLGVSEVRFLGHKDGQLESTLELRRELVKLMREFRPDRVVCHDPTTYFTSSSYINHPDHRAAGRAAIEAVFPAVELHLAFEDLLSEGYEPMRPDDVFMTATDRPNFAVDISDTIDRKIEAIMCHTSQVSEQTPTGLRERLRIAGGLAGYEYAELFRVIDMVHRVYRPTLELMAQAE